MSLQFTISREMVLLSLVVMAEDNEEVLPETRKNFGRVRRLLCFYNQDPHDCQVIDDRNMSYNERLHIII